MKLIFRNDTLINLKITLNLILLIVPCSFQGRILNLMLESSHIIQTFFYLKIGL